LPLSPHRRPKTSMPIPRKTCPRSSLPKSLQTVGLPKNAPFPKGLRMESPDHELGSHPPLRHQRAYAPERASARADSEPSGSERPSAKDTGPLCTSDSLSYGDRSSEDNQPPTSCKTDIRLDLGHDRVYTPLRAHSHARHLSVRLVPLVRAPSSIRR